MTEETRLRAQYHPGNLTSGSPFHQDDAPPFAARTVETQTRPVLYSHDERPIYRRIGFSLPQKGKKP